MIPTNPTNPMTRNPLFRPTQHEILSYRGGKVGVAAVPGSGKTFTLSHLAARLVERLTESGVAEQQEVLIVTFSNSAVNSFKARIGDIIQTQRGLLPYIGYRVRTLHGLAHDIVRERPSLVGLSEDFQILDERAAAVLHREVVESVLKTPVGELFASYVAQQPEGEERNRRRIQTDLVPELAVSVAGAFIRQAKDQARDPSSIRDLFEEYSDELPLARFGLEVYEAYQRSLAYRGAVDFDDLVRLALRCLVTDDSYRKRLQKRWPYILEDEAQDSSLSQERMLRLLSGSKNWVRVGDPNQAINTTFTNSNPRFLRDFLQEANVKPFELAEAGRSAPPIIDLANALVRWTANEHPVEALRAAFYPQDIQATPPGDLQGNPSTDESLIHIHYQPGTNISPEKELDMVAESLARWLAEHPDDTAAVLVPENSRGFKLAEVLRKRDLPYDELLRSTTATRDTALALYQVLVYLATPTDQGALSRLYRDIWWPPHLGKASADQMWRDKAVKAFADLKTVETFLWPASGESPLEAIKVRIERAEAPDLFTDLERFRELVQRWLQTTILPIDQLMLTISQDMFAQPTEIALGYKIAQVLRSAARENPDWRLPQFAEELRAISQNERKFLGFDDVQTGFQPQKGHVTIATMHAAKGLEWDRVYLMAVSNYGFPSAQPYDNYISEPWYIRDGLNLEAEELEQLRVLVADERYHEGDATAQARIDYAAERLRLLYVGITRAKRELIITWNTGRFSAQSAKMINQAALPLVALWEYVTGTLKVE